MRKESSGRDGASRPREFFTGGAGITQIFTKGAGIISESLSENILLGQWVGMIYSIKVPLHGG